MPAKKINTRKNYKSGGYNSKKMRGGAEPTEGGGERILTKEELELEDEVIRLCREWAEHVNIENVNIEQLHNYFIEQLGKISRENIGSLRTDTPLGELIKYLRGIIRTKGEYDEKRVVSDDDILETIQTIKGRLDTGTGDTYKVQMLGELLQLQGQFFPGGFALGLIEHIERHIPWIDREGGLMREYERFASLDKFVFSNEALDGSRFLKSTKSYQKHKIGKEFNSVYPSSFKLQEMTIDNKTYSYIEGPPCAKYYTGHYSSKAEREKPSNDWCRDLSTLLGNFKKYGNFGGFAGDINLYVTTDTRGGTFELREGVQKALATHNCTLTVPYHLLDKGTFRNKVHDQWHKVAKENPAAEEEAVAAEGTPEAAGQPAAGQLDSLIIIEPYDNDFDYQELANECHQVFFLPNPFGGVSVVRPMEGDKVIQQVTKTPFNWDDRTVTDHFLVEGVKMAIHSGADIHGIGNGAKSLKMLPVMFTYEQGLKHLINVITLLNKAADDGSKVDEAGGENVSGRTGGARRVKKSRKKRGRRGRKSKRGSRRN